MNGTFDDDQSVGNMARNTEPLRDGRVPSLGDNFSYTVSSVASSMGGLSIQSRVTLPNGKKVSVMEMTECLKSILPCEDLNHKLTLYRNCFRANEAITRLQGQFRYLESIHDAIAFARVLQRARIITHVCDDTKPFQQGDYFFRIQCYHQPHILNTYKLVSEHSYSGNPMTLIDRLSDLMLKIESESRSGANTLVNYRIVSMHKLFPIFEDMAADLQGVDLGVLDTSTRLAVALNAYNIMIKYAFVKLGVPTTRVTRARFFAEVKINFGGDILSFDDLEHGVIRANKPPPGYLSSTPFAHSDHRRVRLALPKLDYRIHFYLDCYPTPLKPVAVRPESIEKDLDHAARVYLSNHRNLWTCFTTNEICLNKIFSWYSSDFMTRDWRAILSLLEVYTWGAKKLDIQRMLHSDKPPEIIYSEFDWGTEACNFEKFKVSKIRPNEKWGRTLAL